MYQGAVCVYVCVYVGGCVGRWVGGWVGGWVGVGEWVGGRVGVYREGLLLALKEVQQLLPAPPPGRASAKPLTPHSHPMLLLARIAARRGVTGAGTT